MINKKLLAVASIALSISVSSAFAKTEGNYVGVDLLNNRVSLDRDKGSRDNDYGVGVNYKYAFNYNGVFIAPGVFAEKNNVSVASDNGYKFNLKNRYGVKADLGYDIDKDLAVYVTGGLALLNYSLSDSASQFSHRGGIDYFAGAGIAHEYSEKVTLNLEFNTQTANLKSNIANIKANVDINTIKAGVSYRF